MCEHCDCPRCDERGDKIEDLTAAVEDLTAAVEENTDRLDEHGERVEELESAVDPDAVGSKMTVPEEITRANKELHETRARVTTIEDTIDGMESIDGDDGAGTLAREDLTPIEQIAVIPEHVAAEQLDTDRSRNSYRARSVFRDFFDYAKKTPSGWKITSPEIMQICTAQEDRAVESKTGIRVIRRLVDMSDGGLEHVPPSDRRNSSGEHYILLESTDPFVTMETEDRSDGAVSRGEV